MGDFNTDDDLTTFEGYLKYQYGIDSTTITTEQLDEWHRSDDASFERGRTVPKVGLMKISQRTDEERYAVAIRNGSGLWLTLWVRCSSKGEIFILLPRGNRKWDPHASYHLDGTFHQKSYGTIAKAVAQKRQPLTGVFKGVEDLGKYMGHGTGSAECDPASFTGVVAVDAGILGPRTGAVEISLAEKWCEPEPIICSDVIRQIFHRRKCRPSVVITIRKNAN